MYSSKWKVTKVRRCQFTEEKEETQLNGNCRCQVGTRNDDKANMFAKIEIHKYIYNRIETKSWSWSSSISPWWWQPTLNFDHDSGRRWTPDSIGGSACVFTWSSLSFMIYNIKVFVDIFIAKFMHIVWNPYYGFNWTLFIEQYSISYSIPTTNIKVHYFQFFTKLFDFVKMSFDIEEPDNNIRCVFSLKS